MATPTGVRYATRATVLLLSLTLLAACGSSGSGSNAVIGARFLVSNSSGAPVAGARVYLVPADDVDGSSINGVDMRTGASADRDEPLEDAVRLHGTGYLQTVTDAAGTALVPTVPEGRFFCFVAPAPGDTEHLPGGSRSRLALDWTVLNSVDTVITLSSQPSPAATYVGSSRCLNCHSAFATQAQHAHRLGFAVPGQLGPLQDVSRHPDFQDNWARYLPAASHTGGTAVYLSDFDAARGFDKFKTSLSDPTPLGQTVQIRAWFWRDTADGAYKITLENMVNGADPRSPWTLEVALTYGGAVYKQRNLVKVPGRKGLYPLLQYQMQGSETRYDRTRKVYRDYHADWFWDAGASLFQDPPLNKNFEANCTACHSTGFQRFQDAMTSEWMSTAVDDPAGVYDIDGDGSLDEINVGCEVCHGPGSEHVAYRPPAGSGQTRGRYIVTLRNLSPSREMMVCGRCHGRELGNGSIVNDEPLNASNEMLPVGASRHEYLTGGYVQRQGPAASHMWRDELHSKSHHQQYSDLLKSTKHRNGRILVTCTDCHDSHGQAPYPHHLKADPADPVSGLCSSCHFYDLTQHMLEKTGSTHSGAATSCYRCHMADTAKTGAGRYGLLISPPTGMPSDEDVVFYQNDISSHLFLKIPRKGHPDVAGQTPSDAMPIPYTNGCGAPCHDPATIPLFKVSAFQEMLRDDLEAGRNAEERKGPPVEPHEPDDYGSER